MGDPSWSRGDWVGRAHGGYHQMPLQMIQSKSLRNPLLYSACRTGSITRPTFFIPPPLNKDCWYSLEASQNKKKERVTFNHLKVAIIDCITIGPRFQTIIIKTCCFFVRSYRVTCKSRILVYDNTPMHYTVIFHGRKMIIFR